MKGNATTDWQLTGLERSVAKAKAELRGLAADVEQLESLVDVLLGPPPQPALTLVKGGESDA